MHMTSIIILASYNRFASLYCISNLIIVNTNNEIMFTHILCEMLINYIILMNFLDDLFVWPNIGILKTILCQFLVIAACETCVEFG